MYHQRRATSATAELGCAYAYRIMNRVVATDVALPDIPRVATQPPSITIRRATRPLPPPGEMLREEVDAEGRPAFRVFEGLAGVHYWARTVGWFWIETDGRAVWYEPVPGAAASDIEHLVIGPVVGLALQLQGEVILHAGAVAVDGKAVAFTGPHGLGKSTLTASFLRAGHAMLSDDAVPVRFCSDAVLIGHSVPRMKLWGDSLAQFGEDERRYGMVLTGGEKRRVPVDKRWGSIADGWRPLAALYLMEPVLAAAPVTITPVDGVEALLRLMGGMYMADALAGDRGRRAFDAAAQTLERAPVRRLRYCRRYEELSAVHAAIVADVRRLEGAACSPR